MSTLEYRRLQAADLPAVAEFHSALSPYRTVELLRHYYFSDLLPAPGVMVGAFDGQKLVGTQTFIPYRARVAGKEILSAKSEMTLVNPAYRGKNIFDALYERGFAICEQIGIECVWGFTSAVKPFSRVGFQIIGRLYHELLLWHPVRALLARKKLIQVKTNQAGIGNANDDLVDDRRGTFGLIRDQKYLCYRYSQNPARKIATLDTDNGVLYSFGGGERYLLMISEVTPPYRVSESLRSNRGHFVHGWYGVYRMCTAPLFSWNTMIGAIPYRKQATSKIVFRWLGKRAGDPLPSFSIEEGYTEGAA